MKILLGAHTSIAGGIDSAVDRAVKINCNAMQIFTKNNNQWKASPLDSNTIQTYKNKLRLSKIKSVIAHDSYLINLCAKDKEILNKSRLSFIEELKRCELIDILYLNFHPGSHLGQGEKDGIKIIAESINLAHQATKNFKVNTMLETTAGQGTSIGYRFEHLREIIDLIEDKSRMAVCIDTCHIFAAGYDISSKNGYKKTFHDFNSIIGFKYLKAFHINDSKRELGSRVDRHQHIGKGKIGLNGFKLLMNDKRVENIPKILETPKGPDMKEDVLNMKVLRSLVKS
ncbi:MAG: deoxyribonuclease IV [Ignavibacteria bacterium]|nr:deoxyribonuclease IV [Ignavibacteria bacterium]